MKGQMMIDFDVVEPSLLDSWHHLNMQMFLNGWGRSANRHLGEVIDWLNNQEGGRYYWTLSGNFWFEREEDRTLCALTWN